MKTWITLYSLLISFPVLSQDVIVQGPYSRHSVPTQFQGNLRRGEGPMTDCQDFAQSMEKLLDEGDMPHGVAVRFRARAVNELRFGSSLPGTMGNGDIPQTFSLMDHEENLIGFPFAWALKSEELKTEFAADSFSVRTAEHLAFAKNVPALILKGGQVSSADRAFTCDLLAGKVRLSAHYVRAVTVKDRPSDELVDYVLNFSERLQKSQREDFQTSDSSVMKAAILGLRMGRFMQERPQTVGPKQDFRSWFGKLVRNTPEGLVVAPLRAQDDVLKQVFKPVEINQDVAQNWAFGGKVLEL